LLRPSEARHVPPRTKLHVLGIKGLCGCGLQLFGVKGRHSWGHRTRDESKRWLCARRTSATATVTATVAAVSGLGLGLGLGLLALRRQQAAGVGPAKRLGEDVIEVADEREDLVPQVVLRDEAASAQHAASEDAEPAFHLVEP